jgi:hypothetical protein
MLQNKNLCSYDSIRWWRCVFCKRRCQWKYDSIHTNIVLFVPLRLTDSDYPFGIFRLPIWYLQSLLNRLIHWHTTTTTNNNNTIIIIVHRESSVFLIEHYISGGNGWYRINRLRRDWRYQMGNQEELKLSCLSLRVYCSQNFKLFGFSIFWFWAYLMKVLPERRRAH